MQAFAAMACAVVWRQGAARCRHGGWNTIEEGGKQKKLPGLLQVGQFQLLVAVVVFRQGSPASSAVHSLSVSLWFRCQSLILNEAVSGHFGGLFQSHDVED